MSAPATGRGTPEAFAAALAEAGYPTAYAGWDEKRQSPSYYPDYVPDEVAWRAYRATGWDSSPCLACFLTWNKPTDWADACPEFGVQGFPLSCDRPDRIVQP